jgi:hypothetical protein
MALNEFQKMASKVYGGGDFAHVESMDEVNEAGDTLFRFIMIELGEGEDCDSIDTALSRMRMARDDVESVLTALQDEEARRG